MQIIRAGVDRSASYLVEEMDAISIALSAWDGEPGQGSIPIPDPSGTQEPYEGERLQLIEAGVTILDGFVGGVTFDRGQVSVGPRQTGLYAVGDDNALLGGHATTGWSRPAEPPAARWTAFVNDWLPGSINMTWLLATNEVGITLKAKTYRSDDLFADILADAQPQTAKTAYLEHRRFHWHLATEGQTSSLALTDGVANDSIGILGIREPQRIKDAMDLRNELWGRNEAGVVVHVSDATSITRHDSGGMKHQGYQEYSQETSAEMLNDLNATLGERKKERITYTCEVGPLTALQAAALIPGSLINCTSSVWRLSASSQRIARVELDYRRSPDGRPFTAKLELGYQIRLRRKPPRTRTPQEIAQDAGGGAGTDEPCCPPWSGVGVPTPGQEVPFEYVATGDGLLSAWTTSFPYVPGSLQVRIDGIAIAGEVSETSAALGQFSISFTPEVGEIVRAGYFAA